MASNQQQAQARPVDMHVHIVGNGTGGTGCWMRVKGWHRPLAAFMLRHIGLPWSAISVEGVYMTPFRLTPAPPPKVLLPGWPPLVSAAGLLT